MLITVWSVLDHGASLFLSCELLAAGNGLKAASDAGDLSFLSGSNQAIWATLTIHLPVALFAIFGMGQNQ